MPELPSAIGEYYDDEDGNVLYLVWKKNVRITDDDSYYDYEDGVVAIDQDGVIQVLPAEYFNKYFRLTKQKLEEAS